MNLEHDDGSIGGGGWGNACMHMCNRWYRCTPIYIACKKETSSVKKIATVEKKKPGDLAIPAPPTSYHYPTRYNEDLFHPSEKTVDSLLTPHEA